jgi:putative PIN family toxin of toxin-antitoxin system
VVSVTADSNVHVSALNHGGPPAILLDMARRGVIRLDTSEAIIDEVKRVLRDKFDWDGYRLHFMREGLKRMCNMVNPAQTLNVITHDEPDNRILECAREAKSDYIVSADSDLLRFGEFGGAKIMRAADFLKLLRK